MCGGLQTGTSCPEHPECRIACHHATLRQGRRVVEGVVRNLSPDGACVELTAGSVLALGSWVVIADAGHLRGGCEAKIIGIEGERYRLTFDPDFVGAMRHFGKRVARHHPHRHPHPPAHLQDDAPTTL